MINAIDKILDASNFDLGWVRFNLNPEHDFIYHKFIECRLIKGSDGCAIYILILIKGFYSRKIII